RVLLEHEGFQVARRAREERQVRGAAVEAAEARVEAQPPRVRVAVRRTDEGDPGLPAAGLLQEIIDEPQVVELERQRAAAHGQYLSLHFSSPDYRCSQQLQRQGRQAAKEDRRFIHTCHRFEPRRYRPELTLAPWRPWR